MRAVRPIAEQTILVTGATDGLGRALATELARAGATVLIHGRDVVRGRRTLEEIRAHTGNDRLVWLRADFASLDEVRALAHEVSRNYDRLDVLVNNAGIGATSGGDGRRQVSHDGIELRFAVNYLAGYLLTRLLPPLIEQSAPARIVNVSSAGQAPLDCDDLMLEHGYDGVRAYCQSKLAQIMFTFDLAEELRGRDVTATCLHPATYMPTKIVLADGIVPTSELAEGVQATLRLAMDPKLHGVTGRYFDGLRAAQTHPQALDRVARHRLRDFSERVCGLPRVRVSRAS